MYTTCALVVLFVHVESSYVCLRTLSSTHVVVASAQVEVGARRLLLRQVKINTAVRVGLQGVTAVLRCVLLLPIHVHGIDVRLLRSAMNPK